MSETVLEPSADEVRAAIDDLRRVVAEGGSVGLPSAPMILKRIPQCDGLDSPAARAVARGLLTFGHAGDDLWLGEIDAHCEDSDLSTARAIVAIEVRRADLLTSVVARRLARLRGNSAAAVEWLDPILLDEAGQCLLAIGMLSAGEPGDRADRAVLFRDLLAIDQGTWHVGPLRTLRALGELLRDRDGGSITRFRDSVKAWPGWSGGLMWPTRLPGDGLEGLKRRATDFAAEALKMGEARIWRRGTAIDAAVEVWPPLEGFCWRAVAATTERGGRP